jgi:hypothetical protein
MRNVFPAIAAIALVSTLPAAAEQPRQPKSGTSSPAVRQLPLKGANADRSCAAYGAGFVRVDGTQTCVKIGGAVSIGVGGSR